MKRVLIATANAGKLREFRALLGDVARVVSLVDLGLDSPEETGESPGELVGQPRVGGAPGAQEDGGPGHASS